MQQATVTLSNDQASAIAAVIFPAIKGYIAEHREEYEAFLKEWNEQHGIKVVRAQAKQRMEAAI